MLGSESAQTHSGFSPLLCGKNDTETKRYISKEPKRLISKGNGEYYRHIIGLELTAFRIRTPQPSDRGRDGGLSRQESSTKTNSDTRKQESGKQDGRKGKVSGDEQGYRHPSDTESEQPKAEHPEAARRRERQARPEEEVQKGNIEEGKAKSNPGQDLGELSYTQWKCAHNLPFRRQDQN
jgi:hypothetical protein